MELLKISCFLPSVDLKWHLNSTKDCKLVACNKVNIRCTHIVSPHYNSKNITICTFWLHVDFCSGHKVNIWYICNHYPVSNCSDTHQLRCVQCNLCWPQLTLDLPKNNRNLAHIMGKPLAKYDHCHRPPPPSPFLR